jgi:hypothetical protein
MALQHLRSSTADKRPTPGAMSDGQLAMNTNLASPGLFFKDSNGDLVKTGPVHVGTTAPNATPASGGQAGNSKGELWLDTSGTDYTLKTWDGSAWREIVVTSAMIKDGTIVNADVNASAAIDGTKISPNFGSQNVVTTGTSTAASLIPTGSSVPTNGVYLPAANSVAISTNDTKRLEIQANGDIQLGGSSGVFFDATNNRLAIDTTSPDANLQIGNGSAATLESTAPYAWVSARANSNSNNPTTPQELLRLSWQEGAQDLGAGEGCAINFAASLIDDSGTFYPVASIASFKENSSDASRLSALTFSTSANDTAAPTERARINSSGKLLSPNGAAFYGTVSNSGNGAIMERGSNANGDFTKYADGAIVFAVRGAESRSSSGTHTTNVTFPVALAVSPTTFGYVVACTNTAVPATASSISVNGTTSTTGCEVRIERSNSTNTSFYLTGYGRWY